MQSRFLMHLEGFGHKLRNSHCFDFFYWFSRFEYALKENQYVAKGPYGSAAPAWTEFESDFSEVYRLTTEGREFVRRRAQRQVYAGPGTWLLEEGRFVTAKDRSRQGHRECEDHPQ